MQQQQQVRRLMTDYWQSITTGTSATTTREGDSTTETEARLARAEEISSL